MLSAAGGKYDFVWMLMMSLFQTCFLLHTLQHYTTMRLEACGYIITKNLSSVCVIHTHFLVSLIVLSGIYL